MLKGTIAINIKVAIQNKNMVMLTFWLKKSRELENRN